MLYERLPRFNDWLRENAHGDGFAIGIGDRSGPLMSGNVGSERRLEYTAVGDTVNTASRLEALTKEFPHALLVSESTRALLSGRDGELVFVGRDNSARQERVYAAMDAGLNTDGARNSMTHSTTIRRSSRRALPALVVAALLLALCAAAGSSSASSGTRAGGDPTVDKLAQVLARGHDRALHRSGLSAAVVGRSRAPSAWPARSAPRTR